MSVAKILLVAEVTIPDEEEVVEEVTFQLDTFREATRASSEYGITLYKATRADLEEFAEQQALLPNPGILLDC